MNLENLATMLEMRRANKTNAEIAQHFNVSTRTIDFWVRRMKDDGIEVPKYTKKLDVSQLR